MAVFTIRCSGRSGGQSGDCGERLGRVSLPGGPVVGGRDARDGYLCPRCARKERPMFRNAVPLGRGHNSPGLDAAAEIARRLAGVRDLPVIDAFMDRIRLE